ncbi:hypothetical protein [Shewanella sp. NIFS-20-20]|uniref:hypothetical protein n=1 Tax=Shewanella sp. NIFS-20-20 TaxID=2853806 RepID=UPI001C4779B2|nr:hypothetical protein [Shewanella sp. NIFS-20-20]MBV7317200.1 hypothetical protein [Shewanella sp. NIFS-20-20]
MIDNLQPVQTPVDQLATAQKVACIEQLLAGRTIDKILCHSDVSEAAMLSQGRYCFRPLMKEDGDGLHDRRLLLQGIESLL